MKFLKFISLLSVLLLTACHPLQVAQVDITQVDISNQSGIDSNLYYMVEKYKIQLDDQMNIFLTHTPVDMVKAQPCSNLGNMMADILYNYYNKNEKVVDFAISNHGGIRVSSFTKGPLTMGDAYQLMPFDNEIVYIKISGEKVRQLLQHVCNLGGWPISHAEVVMDSSRTIQKISIDGNELIEDKIYTVAMNDYVANGGDQCSFLIGSPTVESGKLFRDAIIETWTHQKDELQVNPEMRLRYEN
ncbi:MAG TPA: 5'-nucleotidase [Chitinophagales bacterium]|nr:5'-nucleotidase [Chitinophagales bacterium]